MEVSALKYQGGIGLHGRSPLLRLQSDERLIVLVRRGNTAAFEVLVGRYESRLLAFCRHLLGSREDAEDVLQEVMTAAFGAIVADERPINVRPWLYRIARNRSLNHLRRTQAIGVDSMDHHLSDHGASTADKVHDREEFRSLVGDIQELPETQRTALVLREMDALSYEQIAEAMETTVSSVKSLLVRARVSLAEAAEARLLSCDEVRVELAEVAEGLLKRPSPLVRRHLRGCKRCATFRTQLRATNKALAALLPVGPLVVVRKLAFLHFGHSAAASSGAAAAGSGATAAAGSTATAGAGAALAGSGAFSGGGLVSAGVGAVATKAAAGLAAAAIVTAGAVEVDGGKGAHHRAHPAPTPAAAVAPAPALAPAAPSAVTPSNSYAEKPSTVTPAHVRHDHVAQEVAQIRTPATTTRARTAPTTSTATTPTTTTTTTTATTPTTTTTAPATTPTTTSPGRVQTQTDPTVLPPTTTAPPPPIGAPATPAPPPPVGAPTTPPVPTTSPAVPTTPVATTPAPTTTAPATTPTTTAPTTTSTAPTTTSTPTQTTPAGTTTTSPATTPPPTDPLPLP